MWCSACSGVPDGLFLSSSRVRHCGVAINSSPSALDYHLSCASIRHTSCALVLRGRIATHVTACVQVLKCGWNVKHRLWQKRCTAAHGLTVNASPDKAVEYCRRKRTTSCMTDVLRCHVQHEVGCI